ncbi:auxin-responsive protein SAUR68-like [Pistacia vera]|uniref:auxin-responsive protein SAUR68-like n=1 Tax=Pistacia vera TaxID=55513 RepID=UPI001263A2A4|nr:auxin-responsive protein SAUR68-like [Pistacia vera]
MAMKWRKAAVEGRKRILFQRASSFANLNGSNTSYVANKGQFVVYTTDCRRFVIPLPFLNNDIFRELMKMSEEAFGLPSDGPITLPCDSFFFEYMVSLIRGSVVKNQDKLKPMSVVTSCCSLSSSLQQEPRHQNVLVCN